VARSALELNLRLRLASRRLLWLIGAIWTSPNSLLGLCVGGVGVLSGARLERTDGALLIADYPWGPRGALVLGQVIISTLDTLEIECPTYASRSGGPMHRVLLSRHEHAHVLQYLTLGPLFLPLYLVCGGVSGSNRFERAADDYARFGVGWWPWPRASRREGTGPSVRRE
jgi:hypothetical protein